MAETAPVVERARGVIRYYEKRRDWSERDALRRFVGDADPEKSEQMRRENGPPLGTILHDVEELARWIVQHAPIVVAAKAQEAAMNAWGRARVGRNECDQRKDEYTRACLRTIESVRASAASSERAP